MVPPELSVNLYLVWDSSGLQLAALEGNRHTSRYRCPCGVWFSCPLLWGYSQHPPPIPVEIAATSSWVMGFPQSSLGGSRKGDSTEKFREQHQRGRGQGRAWQFPKGEHSGLNRVPPECICGSLKPLGDCTWGWELQEELRLSEA